MGRSRLRIACLALVAMMGLSGSRLDGSSPVASDAPPPQQILADDLRGRLNPLLSPGEAERIARAVVHYADKYALAPDLVMAVLEVESTARVGARSPKGAMGLMQVMPHMAARMDLAGNLTTVETNVEAGCMILADNIHRLGEARGISAYFWGNDVRDGRYLEAVQAARARIRREAVASQAG